MHRPENTINHRRPGQFFSVLPGIRIHQVTRILVLASALTFTGLAMSAGDRLNGFSANDTILIHAENAWEDAAPDTVHFSGHFELKAYDWYLSGDQATLYGDLDDPETAILTGSPAKIQLETIANERIKTITGKAIRIVYQRASNSINLVGGASLTTAGQTMQSEEIEYDITQDRIQASGSQGVHIRVDPKD